jgi:hypothetical protein
VSDRVLRFPDRTWDELEALPQPLRNAAHQAIFHLLTYGPPPAGQRMTREEVRARYGV